MNSETKTSIVFVGLVVLVIGSLLISSFAIQPSPASIGTSTTTILSSTTTTLTSTTTSLMKPVTSSIVSLPSGLRLSLTINTTSIASGETIRISVDFFNPLTTPVNLTVGKKWPSNADLFMPPGAGCGTQNYPVGMGIFKGYYSPTNVTSALPFHIYRANGTHPVFFACPVVYVISYYLFSPTSDDALLGPIGPTLRVNGSYSLRGYWVVFTDQIPTRSEFHSLDPGPYTVIAATEWGDMTLLRFYVR